jgi:tetratricopeptide (TPR) repeat protein
VCWLEERERVLGIDHLNTLRSLNNLAGVLRNLGNYEVAKELYLRVLAIREKVLGTDHPDTTRSMGNLALALQDQGRYEEAEKVSRRALDGREGAGGKASGNTEKHKQSSVSATRSGQIRRGREDEPRSVD